MSKKVGTYWRGVEHVPKGLSQEELELSAKSKAQKVLAYLWDMEWAPTWQLVVLVGHRFGASIHVLRQAGWQIKSEKAGDSQFDYRLTSRKLVGATMPKVRLYLPWADAEALTHGKVTKCARRTAEEAIE